MGLSRAFTTAAAVLLFACAQINAAELGVRAGAPFGNQAYGLERKDGEVIIVDEAQALWAPEAQSHEKNASEPLLMGRDLVLNERQTCNPGYGYCAAFGKCCPDTTLCCSYGYCIDPEKTCCPYGACQAGWGCCGTKCAPRDGDCCSNDNYCEAGNICVKIISSGRIVCCTDLKCTAVVVSGSTSYAPTPTIIVPSFTPPPITKVPPPSITPFTPPDVPSSSSKSSSVSEVDVFETWYWTVTWWYYSYWWSTFRATSTVTFTRIFETTTFTTTATDETQARSRFSALSATLTFQPPASAQTSLASLLSATPTETPTLTDENTIGLGAPTSSSSSSSRRSTTTPAGSSASSTALVAGGPGAASGVFLQWTMVVLAAGAGTLMIVL
ncbi:hypothetical protein BCR34DRAFT_607021 [Clohesyomyces aquaticus]|uniref:Granulins domain-containing protein n=1 Tax=Clohesyomyces aquaticus TaxID=1231657 RepID=A0A1Y1YJP1_9PLEO|nr:hypothetical protein BCR34DRAFT_607021 [Clohesyomyces aquaticus]